MFSQLPPHLHFPVLLQPRIKVIIKFIVVTGKLSPPSSETPSLSKNVNIVYNVETIVPLFWFHCLAWVSLADLFLLFVWKKKEFDYMTFITQLLLLRNCVSVIALVPPPVISFSFLSLLKIDEMFCQRQAYKKKQKNLQRSPAPVAPAPVALCALTPKRSPMWCLTAGLTYSFHVAH